MPGRWTVLASGSGGNSSLLEFDGAGLLVDVGLGPRLIEQRMQQADFGWDGVRAVVLTHTHSDHWRKRSIKRLADLRIPLFCHPEHIRPLQLQCPDFQELQFAGLVKTYGDQRDFTPLPGLRCRPIALKHDGGPTFGFRFTSESRENGGWALGYAADLGSWEPALPQAFAEVDILALEFNHDVEMQLASGRARWLIHRVLGEFGHLSNVQAAQLLAECAGFSSAGRLKHVVQLHLSRECNHPTLAVAAARQVLAHLGLPAELHTSDQDVPSLTIPLGKPGARQLQLNLDAGLSGDYAEREDAGVQPSGCATGP